MSEETGLVFVTRPSRPRCDGCGIPSSWGFESLLRGTPVLFECDSCTRMSNSIEAVEAAIEANRQRAFDGAEGGGQW